MESDGRDRRHETPSYGFAVWRRSCGTLHVAVALGMFPARSLAVAVIAYTHRFALIVFIALSPLLAPKGCRLP